MVFCNLGHPTVKSYWVKVTILILIDGFLQYEIEFDMNGEQMSQSLF